MNCSDKEFAATYNCYVDMIYRLCVFFLKNREDTEDVVQSVFIRYLKSGKKFENECHEKAWFIVTASNLCKDMLRQSWRRNISIEASGFIPDTEDSTDNDVYMAILDLPNRQRKLFLYRRKILP